MRRKLLASLAFALLALGCAGLPLNPPGQAEQEVEHSWLEENWASTSLAIVFATLLFLGITYMLSESFNSRELRAWTVAEFFQAGMSALIIFMLVLLFSSLSGLTQALADPITAEPCASGDCHFELAQAYLADVRDVAIELALYTSKRSVSAISKSTFRISLVAVDLIPFMFSGFSIRPYAGYSIYSDRYMLLTDNALRLAASLNAQILFLEYLRQGLVPLLLIGGVVLRSIFFLRRVGGLMIAMAIALFAVYPLLYLLFQYTYTEEWLPGMLSMEVSTQELAGTDIIYCEDTANPEYDPDTCCDRNALYVDYPLAVAGMCDGWCRSRPNPDAPLFAQSACDKECVRACEPGDSVCYRTCATTSSNPYFLCSALDEGGDGTFECDEYARGPTNDGYSDARLYKERALEYLGLEWPEIGVCRDMVVATQDPYAAECGDCPSNRQADCRVTFRQTGPADPDYYENEVLPGLPPACKEGGAADACIACAADTAHLSVFPDPEMQRRCSQPNLLSGGIIPSVEEGDFGSQGDIEALGVLVIPGMVLPIFNFIITITFVKIFSPALGGDVDIEGLTRLI